MNHGRKVIYTDENKITIENIAGVVMKAYAVHTQNSFDADTLYNYYKGKTKILDKTKEIRPEINHKINENRAYEIASFHQGYTFGEPIQYVRRENSAQNSDDDGLATEINLLNGYMADADKAACDSEIAEWLYVAGAGYRMALPSQKGDENPFELYSLDPRNTFVIYSNTVDHRPMVGVHYVTKENGEKSFTAYTEDACYKFTKNGDVSEEPHVLGMIPIIEYPAGNSRLGVFEIVVPLLDALDELQSNRLDDVVQFVNSFLAIIGGELDAETAKNLDEMKMLCLPEGVDAKYLSVAMQQTDVQTLKDDLYQSILTICGVPNRNGGSSTSDTGSAVIMRDGWESAEARAKATELVFKKSEKQFLKLILRIMRDDVGTQLKLSDIEVRFTRRNYENIAAKANVLISMLNCDKIHPELSFAVCNMFADSESAYLQSKKWWEENATNADTKPNTLSDLQS